MSLASSVKISFSALTGSSQTFRNPCNGVPFLHEFLCILASLKCAITAQNNYSMADFSTFFHYIDLKCAENDLKFVKKKLPKILWPKMEFRTVRLVKWPRKEGIFYQIFLGEAPDPPVRGCTLIYPPLTTSWHGSAVFCRRRPAPPVISTGFGFFRIFPLWGCLLNMSTNVSHCDQLEPLLSTQGSKFSDFSLISDFFPTPGTILEISVNLKRIFFLKGRG